MERFCVSKFELEILKGNNVGYAPKHTAHGVGNEGDDFVSEGAHIAAALHGFGNVILGIENSMYRDILVGHLRGQLVLQAVDVDEDAVQFFLVGFQLLEPGFTFGLPGGKFIGDKGPHQITSLVVFLNFLN